MPCFHPYFKILSPHHDKPSALPCGKCAYCRSINQKTWSLRLFLEAKRYENICFTTLTYNQEHCPSDYSLKPSHLQSFIKRLRYYLPKGLKIRYFAVGEYGTRKGRPHYHILFFGLPRVYYHYVKYAWDYGMIDIDTPRNNQATIKYVTNYVMKKIGSLKEVSNYYFGRTPPFLRVSKGMGLFFVEKMKFYVDKIKIGRSLYTIGRYLKRKLAEKFGILEAVTADGIELLYENTIDLFSKGMNSPNFDKTISISRGKWKYAYQLAVQPFKDEFIKKLNLWSLKYELKYR